MTMNIMNYSLKIGWLYPELMSTYGDRGNIIILQKRCAWRGIEIDIQTIDFKTVRQDIEKCNLFFGGGSQDRQQGILIDDLRKNKGPVLKEMIDNGIPGLFVCGSPQLLGHYFIDGNGNKLEGLGIFDMVSTYPSKGTPRCIGNLVAEITNLKSQIPNKHKTIVGFENHGGRTYLNITQNSKVKNQKYETLKKTSIQPFAKVLYGKGNNGEDGTEGAVYKNCIATYSHGPFLSKNPHIADWLIKMALEVKYKKEMILNQLDDTLEWQAHETMLKKFVK